MLITTVFSSSLFAGAGSCEVRQAAPNPGQSGELHARRLKAESLCSASMPNSEMTFSERVDAKARVLERKKKKTRCVRQTLKGKRALSSDSSSSFDGNSSLSSQTSASDEVVGFDDMVTAMAEHS